MKPPLGLPIPTPTPLPYAGTTLNPGSGPNLFVDIMLPVIIVVLVGCLLCIGGFMVAWINARETDT